jgi:phosphoglycolate phosphatase-like HAD superfamily hydrolase
MKNKFVIFDFSGTLVRMRPATLLTDKNLICQLSRKYPLGIITGAKKSETNNILRKLSMENIFSQVITADDSGLRKPDPNLFFTKPMFYIGDTKKDELFAKNAKVKFLRVNKKTNINKIIKYLLK